MTEPQICSRCIMDTTVPRISFDAAGVCSYCYFHDALDAEYRLGPETDQKLKHIFHRTKHEGRGKAFDCVVGISGGRDSTFLLHFLSRDVGLRCLPVYFNDGFGNPTAGENMQKLTHALGLPMRTVSADWRESKDLKIACLKASVPDLNLATDLGLASALYGAAAQEQVRTIFIGQSFRTEGIAPLEWNYLDGRYLDAIHSRFSQIPLRPWTPTAPGFRLNWQHLLYFSLVRRIKVITPLYYMNYVRADVDDLLAEHYGWTNPGAHYYDDLYQSLLTYVLRTKFTVDRRKFNYSALIRSGQMTRQQGIELISQPYAIEDPKVVELCIKRLGLTREEFQELVDLPPKTFWDYPNLLTVLRRFRFAIRLLAHYNLVPKSSYLKYCDPDM